MASGFLRSLLKTTSYRKCLKNLHVDILNESFSLFFKLLRCTPALNSLIESKMKCHFLYLFLFFFFYELHRVCNVLNKSKLGIKCVGKDYN